MNSKKINNLIDKSIPTSRTILINGVAFVIKDEVKCYIKNMKLKPLTIEDLDKIEVGMIEWYRIRNTKITNSMNAENFLEYFDPDVVKFDKREKQVPRFSYHEMIDFAERFNEMKVKQIEIDNQQLHKTRDQLKRHLR